MRKKQGTNCYRNKGEYVDQKEAEKIKKKLANRNHQQLHPQQLHPQQDKIIMFDYNIIIYYVW